MWGETLFTEITFLYILMPITITYFGTAKAISTLTGSEMNYTGFSDCCCMSVELF